MNPQTLYNQSLDYLEGKGVQKNLKKSFDLNAQAAEAGYHDATLAMGWYYFNSIGVPQDFTKAKLWGKKSARQGEPKAMFNLGEIAYIQRDFVNAKLWFHRALKIGHSKSGFWLGKIYWHGYGTKVNKKKAMQLFTTAATKKVKDAQRTLRWINRKSH